LQVLFTLVGVICILFFQWILSPFIARVKEAPDFFHKHVLGDYHTPATGSPSPVDKYDEYVRGFAKVYFDFLKNVLVVSGIFYAARTINSPILYMVFGVSILVFLAGYWVRLAIFCENFIKSKRWAIALKLLALPVVAGLLLVSFSIVVFVLNEFVRAQSQH
jgi:hypothetical protein